MRGENLGINKDSILSLNRIVTSKGCWILSNSTGNYPGLWINGKGFRLNRIVAHLWHGLDLNNPNTLACHKCNNRKCFNPEHIYIGTYQSNVIDMVKSGDHGQVKRKLCKLGHELDGVKHRSNGRKERYCKQCQILANVRHRRPGVA